MAGAGVSGLDSGGGVGIFPCSKVPGGLEGTRTVTGEGPRHHRTKDPIAPPEEILSEDEESRGDAEIGLDSDSGVLLDTGVVRSGC